MAYPGVPAVGMGGMSNVPVQPPQQQEKFDSAIEFLERVKVVYADQPAVYNQFLDIMKVRPIHKGQSNQSLSSSSTTPSLHPSSLSPRPQHLTALIPASSRAKLSQPSA
jgi:hypothetical protein